MATLGEAVVKIRASLDQLKKDLSTARKMVSKALKPLELAATSLVGGALKSVTSLVTGTIKTALSGIKFLVRTAINLIVSTIKLMAMAIKKTVEVVIKSLKKLVKFLTIAVVAAFGLAGTEAAKFQKQLAFINTMLDDNSLPLMRDFEREINRLAKQFGQSTATLSKGLFDILSASIGAEDAIGVLEVSARAAVAGLTETGIAADVLTTIINSYRMEASDAAEISDKLFATVKRGKTTFPELAQSLGRVTSTAAIAGLSLDELLATIATLTRSGIQTTEAVTSINGVLRAFLSPQDDAIKAAKEFGLELSSTTLRTIGFIGAVEALNGATAEQLARLIPNIRAFKALAGSVQNLEGLQKDLQLISVESAGRTQEAYEKMAAVVALKTQQLRESFRAVARALGRPLLNALGRLIDFFRSGLGQLEQFVKNNEMVIEKWANIIVDAVIKITGKIKTFFVDNKQVIADWWTASKARFSDFIANTLPDLKSKFVEVFNTIRGWLKSTMDFIQKWGPVFSNVFTTSIDIAEKAFNRFMATVKEFGLVETLSAIAERIGTSIVNSLKVAIDSVAEFIKENQQIIEAGLSIGKSLGEGIAKGIQKSFPRLFKAGEITADVSGILEDALVDKPKRFIEGLAKGVRKITDLVKITEPNIPEPVQTVNPEILERPREERVPELEGIKRPTGQTEKILKSLLGREKEPVDLSNKDVEAFSAELAKQQESNSNLADVINRLTISISDISPIIIERQMPQMPELDSFDETMNRRRDLFVPQFGAPAERQNEQILDELRGINRNTQKTLTGNVG